MTQTNFYKYFIMYFILFGIVISTFSAFTSYMFQLESVYKNMDEKALEIFAIKSNTILKPKIEDMDKLVRALGLNKTIRDFVITKDEHKQAELEQIFLAVASSQKIIMQARLIDKNGKEIIRIHRFDENEQPVIVEKSKLQDKSDRYYFNVVSKMNTQSVWHSKLDLNIEEHKVEVPYKPTIRIAMPLFEKNEFVGMVIVNLLTNELFTSIGESSMFKHYIVDKENDYILHPEEQFSLNKYKKIERSLSDDFPEGLDEKGIYTYPLNDILKNEDNARFILKIKEDYKEILINKAIKTALSVLFLSIVLSFIGAMLISKTPVKMQKALLKAHEKLNEFAAIIDQYVITTTTKHDTTILKVSSAFTELSGYSKEELIGQKMNVVHYPNEDELLYKELCESVSSGKKWAREVKNRKKDGSVFWLEQHVVPTLTPEQKVESVIFLGVDISAKKELETLASIDKLTGIYNRRMVDEFISIEVQSHKRKGASLSVIMIDIDHFKSVNDTYGHQTGDVVLAQCAKIVSQKIRKSDIFGRYGGEEFIVICPETTAEEASLLAEKLRLAVESFNFAEVGHKSISLGVADFEEGDDGDAIIKKADSALYRAKNEGRNRFVSYSAIKS